VTHVVKLKVVHTPSGVGVRINRLVPQRPRSARTRLDSSVRVQPELEAVTCTATSHQHQRRQIAQSRGADTQPHAPHNGLPVRAVALQRNPPFAVHVVSQRLHTRREGGRVGVDGAIGKTVGSPAIVLHRGSASTASEACRKATLTPDRPHNAWHAGRTTLQNS